MGDGMNCVTTPKTGVTHGDATTPQNRCVTTPPPTGGVGVVTQRHLCTRGVTQMAGHENRRSSR